MPAEFLSNLPKNLPKNLTTHLMHKLYAVFPLKFPFLLHQSRTAPQFSKFPENFHEMAVSTCYTKTNENSSH